MNFVVSTHSYLLLISLNQSWQLENIEVLSNGHHYGIALLAYDGNGFIAKGGKGERLTTYIFNNEESRYRAYTHRQLNENYKYIHQIAIGHDGLYFANTNFNRLDYISLKNENCQVSYCFGDEPYDVNHINSVFPCSSDIVLCLLHNRGQKESELAVMQRNKRKGFKLINRLPLWDWGCHNIFLNKNLLAYNSSEKGDFVGVDLNKERILFRIKFPGHTKGLSVIDRYYIIGFSDFAKRKDRKITKGYLAVIDRRTLKWVATIDLNHKSVASSVGNVNEIRCLSNIDYGQANNDSSVLDYSRLKLSKGDLHYQIKKRASITMSKLKIAKKIY